MSRNAPNSYIYFTSFTFDGRWVDLLREGRFLRKRKRTKATPLLPPI